MKQRFLDANNLDDLDMKKHAYLSQSALSETITAILLPLVKLQGAESKTLHEQSKTIKDLRSSIMSHDSDLKILQRGYTQFGVINKQFARLESEVELKLGEVSSRQATGEMLAESLKYDMERAKKKNDVDQA